MMKSAMRNQMKIMKANNLFKKKDFVYASHLKEIISCKQWTSKSVRSLLLISYNFLEKNLWSSVSVCLILTAKY